MKRTLKTLAVIAGMAYNLWAYTQLQGILVPENVILPPIVDTYTLGIGLSFLFIAGFHLLRLFHTFYFLPRMKKNYFWGPCSSVAWSCLASISDLMSPF